MKISKDELLHHRLQAALRENEFPPDELLYLGEKNGEYWYLVGGENEVKVSDIVSFEQEDI